MHGIVDVVAKYFIFLAALIALYFWFKLPLNQKKTFIIAAIIGGVLALIFAKIGSKLFYDPRPFVVGHFKPYFYHAPDNGFPSDHELLASLLAYLVWKYSKPWGAVLFGFAIIIGAARVIAGIHHTIDIVGAMVCSLVAVVIAYLITSQIKVLTKDAPKTPQNK